MIYLSKLDLTNWQKNFKRLKCIVDLLGIIWSIFILFFTISDYMKFGFEPAENYLRSWFGPTLLSCSVKNLNKPKISGKRLIYDYEAVVEAPSFRLRKQYPYKIELIPLNPSGGFWIEKKHISSLKKDNIPLRQTNFRINHKPAFLSINSSFPSESLKIRFNILTTAQIEKGKEEECIVKIR